MKPKVLVAIISNQEAENTKFKLSVQNMAMRTKAVADVEMSTFGAPYIEQMRNDAADYAVKNEFTHLFEVDTDMMYPIISIIRLLKHEKDFVTGCTRQRKPPFLPMHYKEILQDKTFQAVDNRVFMNGQKGLVKVGASSVCGALITTKALKKVGFPYFQNVFDAQLHALRLGEDIYLCNRLREEGIEMFVDAGLKYSHKIDAWIDDVGILSYWGGRAYRLEGIMSPVSSEGKGENASSN